MGVTEQRKATRSTLAMKKTQGAVRPVRLDVEFEGHGLSFIPFKGRQIVVAAQMGQALDYENDGQKLVDSVRDNWGDEFIEDHDYKVLAGKDLRELKDALRLTRNLRVSRARHLMVLFEPGFDLVCQKTEKPAGKRLRRYLADEVIPKLRRGGTVTTMPRAKPLRPRASLSKADRKALSMIPIIMDKLVAMDRGRPGEITASPGGAIGTKKARDEILNPLIEIARIEARAVGRRDQQAINTMRFLADRALRHEIKFEMKLTCSWANMPLSLMNAAQGALRRMLAEAKKKAALAGAVEVERVIVGDDGQVKATAGTTLVRASSGMEQLSLRPSNKPN